MSLWVSKKHWVREMGESPSVMSPVRPIVARVYLVFELIWKPIMMPRAISPGFRGYFVREMNETG